MQILEKPQRLQLDILIAFLPLQRRLKKLFPERVPSPSFSLIRNQPSSPVGRSMPSARISEVKARKRLRKSAGRSPGERCRCT